MASELSGDDLGQILQRKTTMLGEVMVPDSTLTSKKKFMIRLLIEFHKSGLMTFRTEKLLKRIAKALDIITTCTIQPGRVLISFQEDLNFDPSKTAFYTFSTSSDDLVVASFMDLVKLSALEQLYFDLMSEKIDFFDASEQLYTIENAPGLYNNEMKFISRFVISATCSIMFYGGNWIDGMVSGILGMLTCIMDNESDKFPGITHILSFVNSFIVGVVGTIFDRYIFHDTQFGLCAKAFLLGGSVFSFPGLMITMSFLELYSGQTTYGATKLIHGVCQASQIGFGLALGYLLVAGEAKTPISFEQGCPEGISKVWDLLFVPLYVAALGIQLNSSLKQFVGSIIISVIAYSTGIILDAVDIPFEVTPFLTAIVITTSARLYAWCNGNERPIIYIITGLMMVTPGAMGVNGSFNTSMGDSINTGLSFTARMITIGIGIAIGVFISLIPNLSWVKSISKLMRCNSVIAICTDIASVVNMSFKIGGGDDDDDGDEETGIASKCWTCMNNDGHYGCNNDGDGSDNDDDDDDDDNDDDNDEASPMSFYERLRSYSALT